MKKICLFGDSLCKGVVYDPGMGRYTFLKDSFASRLAGEGRLDVFNYSKFGCTIGKAQSIISRHLPEAEGADVTALEFGGNDSDHNWAAIAENPDAQHVSNTPLEQFTERYAATIRSLKEQGANVVLVNLPPVDPQRYFDWFSKGLNKENILRWLGGSVEYIYRWHESYSVRISQIAVRCGVPLLDIRSPFLLRRDYRDLLCLDGIHPNQAGHALIGAALQSQLPALGRLPQFAGA